jgi:8-oxo-dGTP pyrophosphatase MutT (NUDIX family)
LNTQKEKSRHHGAVMRTKNTNTAAWGDIAMRSLKKGQADKLMQYAALPYRVSPDQRTEIMLITSRQTRRWIIPKGWPQKDKPPHHCAAREAFEEAGVLGAIEPRAIGSFSHSKRLKGGDTVACEVIVFPLKVDRQNKKWPEMDERDVKWLSARQAAKAVRHRELSEIISRLARTKAS